jgi:hypothetical protein
VGIKAFILLTGIGHEINVLGSGGDDDEYVLLMRSCIKWAHFIITVLVYYYYYFFLLQLGIHPGDSRSYTDTRKDYNIKGTIQNKVHTINKVHSANPNIESQTRESDCVRWH